MLLSISNPGPTSELYKLDIPSKTPTHVVTLDPSDTIVDLRVLSNGNALLVGAAQSNQEQVILIDGVGGILKTYEVDPSTQVYTVAPDSDGTSFWTETTANQVYRVDIASGSV